MFGISLVQMRCEKGDFCKNLDTISYYLAEANQRRCNFVFELAAPGLYGEQATRNWEESYKWWESECQKYLSGFVRKDYF